MGKKVIDTWVKKIWPIMKCEVNLRAQGYN